MKEWYVEFYIGTMLHSYVVEAECQLEAMLVAIKGINKGVRPFVSDFKVERKYPEWN